MIPGHVHISRVSKLGSMIPCVNLPAGSTCNPSAPCFSKCYARKGRFRFESVKNLMESNLALYLSEPEFYQRDVAIAASTCKYFRWHSSGDIPDAQYFDMMVRIANDIPDTNFLCFTKKYSIVNNYLNRGHSIPENLTVVFSIWGDFGSDQNPYNLPCAYIKFKDQMAEIPVAARECSGFCGDCVIDGKSCWHLERGESVYFCEH